MKLCGRNFLIYSLAAILLFSITGCQTQSISSYYHGLQTNSTESLPLPGKERQPGKWKTYDLLLDYQYQADGNSLKITGDTTLSDAYQINMSYLRRLNLFLFFLDKDSRVLETAQLLKMVSGDLGTKFSFKKTLEIPPSTKAISFGYDGIAKGGQGRTRFEHLPKSGH